MKLELVTRKDVSCVELQKDEKKFLGLFFRDGIQDEAGPVVKNVKPKSPAAKSFAVAKGDVVLSVNGSSTVGAKSKEVRQLLNSAGPTVYLQLQYKTQEARILESGVYRKQRLTTRLHKVDGSFDFVLRRNDSRYSFTMEYPIISGLKEGTQIHKNGQLQEGDRLLKVDGVSLSWLDLPSIASMMQDKDVAEFTFEYNVRVNNFTETEAVELEINAPVSDLGVSFCSTDGECCGIHVDSIRQGSVAERCGVLLKGDIILSINDIDTKLLTASKAERLLQNTRSRKVSFVARRNEQQVAEDPLNEVSSCSTESEFLPVTTPTSYSANSQAATLGRMCTNTPASSNFYSSYVSEGSNSQRFYHSEQFKIMDSLQCTVSSMSCLKQRLSTLTQKAFEKSQNKLNQNCMSCNQTEHAVKLCISCLGSMNTKCAQSADSLKNAVARFVRLSTDYFDKDDKDPENVSVRNTIHVLKESLTDALRVPQLGEIFHDLAEKMSAAANASCSTCHVEVRSVMILVQQLMLVLSVTDGSSEFQNLIEHLVNCLLNCEFSCDADTECTHSAKTVYTPSNASVSQLEDSVSVRIDFDCSTPRSRVRHNSETESNGVCNSESGSDLNSLHINTTANHDFLKLIPSLSESVEDNASVPRLTHNTPVSSDAEEIRQDCCSASAVSLSHQSATEVKQTLKSFDFSKVWKSLEVIGSRFIKPGRTDKVENACPPVPDVCKTPSRLSEVGREDLDDQNGSLHSRLSSDRRLFNTPCQSTIEKTTSSNYLADVSSLFSSRTTIPLKARKTHTETMIVELTNEGRGFGLDVSFDEDSSSKNPVINFIEQKSPSHKIGILKLGDRILAINNRSTSKLTPRQLHRLKKTAFAAGVITLVVEFDAFDDDYKFGIFDVVLDKSQLKAGLIFEGMEFPDLSRLKKGSPIIVSGIAKGSAAHRSGQVFSGDKIKLFRCTKSEDYNPISGNYDKKDVVVITVQRYPHEVPGVVKKDDRSDSSSSPRRDEHVLANGGPNLFDLKKTTVRPHEKKAHKFVLEHELTLFRDPSSGDFGFLLGEHQDTGCAYVQKIRPRGPAHQSGVMKKLDQIVEINGVLVDRAAKNSGLELFAQADHKVDLLIRRTYRENLTGIRT